MKRLKQFDASAATQRELCLDDVGPSRFTSQQAPSTAGALITSKPCGVHQCPYRSRASSSGSTINTSGRRRGPDALVTHDSIAPSQHACQMSSVENVQRKQLRTFDEHPALSLRRWVLLAAGRRHQWVLMTLRGR